MNNSPLPWMNVNTGEVGNCYPDTITTTYPYNNYYIPSGTPQWQLVQLDGKVFKLNNVTGETWVYILGKWEPVKTMEE